MLLLLSAPVLSAQDGAAIFKERCASCHDMPTGRTPALSAIKSMSGEAIYATLTNGTMKTQAEGLSLPQLLMLIRYIGPTAGTTTEAIQRTCKADPPFAATGAQWNGWSPGVTNSRFQEARSAGLTASNVRALKLKWAFNQGDVALARSQPTVVGGRVFLGTATGVVYSLDANTGCTYWGFRANAALRSGVTIGVANGTPVVYFGDSSATVFAVNAQTGKEIWKIRPVDHFASMISAAPQVHNGVVYQAFSSIEEVLAPDATYPCCTFRGSVVALDAATGKKLWQSFTIPEPKPTRKSPLGTQLHGPSGAGVWSTPTIDEKLGVLYVATGDNYSDPASKTSDAVLAMDLKTGGVLWSQQMTENDAFNTGCSTPQLTNCPDAKGPDFDFGQPPILVQLGGDRRALVIAQKSGMVHALDPDKQGAILWQARASKGSALGGSQWGSASDGQKIYVAISDVGIRGEADPTSPMGFRMAVDPKQGGGLHAFDLKTGKAVWEAKPSPCAATQKICSPAQSAAVTAIPGVVFSGSVDGHLRAYSASKGEVLWDVDTAREFATVNGKPARGGSMDIAGPAVVNGMVFVNSGYGQWGGMPGNVMLVFSVDGK